jgi:ABC-2 type transport system ATP-binding protein
VHRLSGGQTQRLRFALAIAGDPALLVLDEPTTAMDVRSRHDFWRTVRGYAARGATVLFTTHHMDEADENADRIVVVAGGRVVLDGTPGAIKAAAGEQRVRFTVGTGDLAGLELLPGVTAVQPHGTSVTLRTTDAEATVRALVTSRASTPDLEVTGAGLEDAFLALTH